MAPLDDFFSVAMGRGRDCFYNENALEWNRYIPQVLKGLAMHPPLVMPFAGSVFQSDTAMLRPGTRFVKDLPASLHSARPLSPPIITSATLAQSASRAPWAGYAPPVQPGPELHPGSTRTYHLVGAFGEWMAGPLPMTSGSDGRLRQRLEVRVNAQAGNSGLAREEFQILGDGLWDKRLYPAGGAHKDIVILNSAGLISKAATGRGRGHGRNWAVEGLPGTVFEIIYDPTTATVSCELVSTQIKF